eukprot:6352829-Alexandrium_andersonii.AAC.1
MPKHPQRPFLQHVARVPPKSHPSSPPCSLPTLLQNTLPAPPSHHRCAPALPTWGLGGRGVVVRGVVGQQHQQQQQQGNANQPITT